MGKHRVIAGIYEILNIVNGKRYIGYSENILKRWDNHKYKLRREESCSPHLQSSWCVYGEKAFVFSIIEVLPSGLTKQEYEAVETKWVLHFKTNKQEFGYNAVMPGSYPMNEEGDNKSILFGENRVGTSFMCINTTSGEVTNLIGRKKVVEFTGISESKIGDLADYWKNIGKRKSLKGWMIVREEDYSPEYDYINFKRVRHVENKKTWRDYEANRASRKKAPEDIIPHTERNLKRRGIIAVNIATGEEKEYRMVKDSYVDFCKGKVTMCLRFPFGAHQHRGHYFRYNDV